MGICCSNDCSQEIFNMYAPAEMRRPEAFVQATAAPKKKDSNEDIRKFPGFESVVDEFEHEEDQNQKNNVETA